MNLNDFSLNLLRTTEGNVFCSPKNIQDCLAMIYVGAKEKTLKAFNDNTGLSLKQEETIAHIQQLNAVLEQNKDVIIKCAYGAWAQENIHFDAGYLKFINDFHAKLSKVNYLNKENYATIADDVNKFVSEATEGKIKNLVDENFFNKDSIITLVSAIYFLGKWNKAFNKEETFERPFHINAKSTTSLNMMNQECKFFYGENEDVQVLEMPYQGEELVMQVVLPKTDLAKIESKLNDNYLTGIQCSKTKVHVAMPKFKVESTINLKPVFQKLGLGIIMENSADFSGICPSDPIKVGAAIHKAFVDVTEEGTEASAATAIGMVRRTAVMPKQVIYFICDKPFIYMIAHKPSNTILFLGRFTGE